MIEDTQPCQTSPHQVSDKFFKNMLQHPQAAKDFLQHHLPSTLQQHVNLEELTLMQNTFVDRHYRKKEVDVLYQTAWQEHSLYLYLLCEHQTQPDRWLPLRLLNYLVRIWEFHHRQHPDSKKLPLIYPLIFYPAKNRWKYSLDLQSLIDAPTELIDRYFLKPAQLIHPQPVNEFELANHPWSSTFGSAMHHVTARCTLPELERIFPTLNQLAQRGKIAYVIEVLDFIIVKGDGDPLEYQKLIEKHFDTPLEEQLMTLAQRFEQRGIQEGRQEGRQEGIQTQATQTAERMLTMGLPVEIIAKATGLPLEEILSIQITGSRQDG
ncbi:MAG: Rpn family recombination-promoting nuclease/putative transposase [Legionellales bacterium]|nr:Rpn family recombination-promoting nuclease/putative transposase [Legionellales bacterium]